MAIRSIFGTVEAVKAGIENLGIAELKREMAERNDLLLVDIRELQETVDLGTIPGAVHAPRGMLEFWADPSSPYYRNWFAEDKRIVVFCAGGGRSALAAKALKEMGFPRRPANRWRTSRSRAAGCASQRRTSGRPSGSATCCSQCPTSRRAGTSS
jgi:rhodanese-related sulfurtransferase